MNKNNGFWEWFKPKLLVAWSFIKKYWKRFQITRWIILVVMIMILVLSGYWTYKAKTSNVSDLQSSLQTKTTIIDKDGRSEEHTSELQSRFDLVCRLLLE